MSEAFGSSRSLFAWMAGVPLALWLAISRAAVPAPAAPAPAGSSATVAPSASTAATPAPTVVGASQPADHPSALCLARFLAPIYAMAGAQAPAAADVVAKDWEAHVTNGALALRSAFDAVQAEAFIGTIPDPIDSGLSYAFETGIQSIRRGVEHGAGTPLFRDRAWLPWDDREVEPAKQREVEACRAVLPGVMLFRGGDAGGGGRLALLLLVGESPNTGLRQLAMKRALTIAELFSYPEPDPPNVLRRIRVVGPTFSASAQSLRAAMRSWASEHSNLAVDYQVISGTATGSEVQKWLGGVSTQLTDKSTLSYRATTVPAAMLECSYLYFLKGQLGVAPIAGGDVKALEGVATLSESGTEFGSTATSSDATNRCQWRPELSFHFPFHVSALRDAYEKLDKTGAKETISNHALSLDPSLREVRLALDVEGTPSQKASTAEDLSLGRVLSLVSSRHVRHLAIRATDVGDAIFLARRIRDVAPDVRLAFFDSDVLLLHAAFRRQLLGSLVVTPYPFHGLTELAAKAQHDTSFDGFVSGHSQGLFNAAVAQRSERVDLSHLLNYKVGATSPLPVWIASIGRGSMVPLKVTPSADCDQVLYGTGLSQDDKLKSFCQPSVDEKRRVSWQEFSSSHSEALQAPPTNHLPYSWDFLFAALCFALALDYGFQKRQRHRLSGREFPKNLATSKDEHDQDLDLAIGRTKWRLYATIRSFLFVLVFGHMGAVYGLSAAARDGVVGNAWQVIQLVLASGAFIFALGLHARSARDFFGDFRAFARCVKAPMVLANPLEAMRESVTSGRDAPLDGQGSPAAPLVDSRRGWGHRFSLSFGVAHPIGRDVTAGVSFAQLRLLVVVSTIVATAFSILFLADIYTSAELGELVLNDQTHERALSRLTLHALRQADLTSGVSPATPALFCMLAAYLWAVGRMSRLALAHATSRLSPPDGEADLVSTPIRLILHPTYDPSDQDSDAGFTHAERNLLNAIWRPITGPYYVLAAVALAFFPLVLFFLKPPSTLSGTAGTLFLSAGLALCVYLIGITIAQLTQYWLALKRLLKRVLEHPLGPAFASVPAFARDSVDHQVSRLPDEELRWSACAQQFCELMREVKAIDGVPDIEKERAALLDEDESGHPPAYRLNKLREQALARAQHTPRPAGVEVESSFHPVAKRVEAEARLCRGVIHFAHLVTRLLEKPWQKEARCRVEQPKVQPAPARVTAQLELKWRAAVGDETGMELTAHEERGSGQYSSWRVPHAFGVTASSEPPPPASPTGPQRGTLDGADESSVDALSPGANAYTAGEIRWLRKAQTFVATVVTLIVHRHVRQFRYFVQVTTGCGLLLLLAVANYPFQPYRLLLTFIWVVMGTVVASSLWVFVQLDRNTLISLISGSDPQSVTFDGALFLRVFAWAIVPLLSVAAAQYPEVADALYQLLSPFEHALR